MAHFALCAKCPIGGESRTRISITADGSDGRYGNVTCVINGSTSGLCPTYNFNPANNQITNTGYTYDAASNLTSDGTSSYQYDAEGRLLAKPRVAPAKSKSNLDKPVLRPPVFESATAAIVCNFQ